MGIVILVLFRFYLLIEWTLKVLGETYLRGSRVETVRMLFVLILSSKLEVEEENWCLKC